MEITAKMVKELRDLTAAGMMECKKALQEAGADMEKAIEILRISGAAKAEKKQGRTAAEGVIISAVQGHCGVVVEVNCETDFAAKNEGFVELTQEISKIATGISSLEQLTQATIGAGQTVDDACKGLTAKIGEKILARRFHRVEAAGSVAAYNHGGRIAVLVGLDVDNPELAKDIAMHIAASSPIVIGADDVPADLIAKEKAIFIAQASESGKPADIIEKMIDGRIKKYLAEVSLEGQPFVKDPNQTIAQLLKSKGAKVTSFVRFAVGEGIEKEEVDFAKEVMSTIGS